MPIFSFVGESGEYNDGVRIELRRLLDDTEPARASINSDGDVASGLTYRFVELPHGPDVDDGECGSGCDMRLLRCIGCMPLPSNSTASCFGGKLTGDDEP